MGCFFDDYASPPSCCDMCLTPNRGKTNTCCGCYCHPPAADGGARPAPEREEAGLARGPEVIEASDTRRVFAAVESDGRLEVWVEFRPDRRYRWDPDVDSGLSLTAAGADALRALLGEKGGGR